MKVLKGPCLALWFWRTYQCKLIGFYDPFSWCLKNLAIQLSLNLQTVTTFGNRMPWLYRICMTLLKVMYRDKRRKSRKTEAYLWRRHLHEFVFWKRVRQHLLSCFRSLFRSSVSSRVTSINFFLEDNVCFFCFHIYWYKQVDSVLLLCIRPLLLISILSVLFELHLFSHDMVTSFSSP